MVDQVARARDMAYVKAMRERAKQIGNANYKRTLILAFEEMGCSCQPVRGELKALESEITASTKEQLRTWLLAECASPAFVDQITENMTALSRKYREFSGAHPGWAQAEAMRELIRDKDREEHGPLNQMAHQASYALEFWLLSQDIGVLSYTDKEIAERFAVEWIAGWRPQRG